MTARFFKTGLLLVLTILALGSLPGAAWSERSPVPQAGVPNSEHAGDARVIVKYKADSVLMRALSVSSQGNTRPQHAAALSQRLRLPLTNGRVLGSRTQGLRATGLSSSQLAAQLAGLPDVEWAVPDQRRRIAALTNDPFLVGGQTTITPAVGQWYLRAPDNIAVSAINAVGAWDLTTGSPGTTVAVLDTGVRFDHPDLAGKLHAGYDFVHDSPTANDNDGRDADASDPGDWSNAGECGVGEPARDSSWHGTQVAGLIAAATNDGIGMAGVGRNVMVLPVRVLGRCGGFDSDIIAAMRWAAGLTSDVGFGAVVTKVNDHPARVINLSLGSGGSCPASYRDVIAELTLARVAVVASAGNDNGLAVNSPANCAGAIAVAGLRHVGSKVGYSAVGPEVSIAAPAGNCVNIGGPCLFPLLTSINTGTTTPLANSYSDSADPSLGTSFSAPLVAGTVGLMLSVNPALTSDRIKVALQSSARSFPTSGGESNATACRAPDGVPQLECYCTATTCGAGMLDAAGAVTKALNPFAGFSASTTTPTVGSVLVLDASSSAASVGQAIAGYQWTITAGASSASFSGATNTITATLNTTAPGIVTVLLSVTDSLGRVSLSSTSFTVVAPPASGSGGGALGWGWLLALAAGVVGIGVKQVRRARPG